MKRRLVEALAGIMIVGMINTMQVYAADVDTKIMFAALVMAEAGNQDVTGKRLVADTVLNRVHDPRFPNTIEEVICQPFQYGVVDNGLLQSYMSGEKKILEECYQVVDEELIDQVDYDVIYFCAGGWSAYGERAFKYQDHYFSR